MSDNVTNEGFARIYQFLNNHKKWQDEADTIVKDGIIVKSEFKSYMLGNLTGWNGNETRESGNDLLNKFWDSIDVNSVGRSNEVNGANKGALDHNELNAMRRNLLISDHLRDHIKDLQDQIPADIKADAGIRDRFNESFKASLLNNAINDSEIQAAFDPNVDYDTNLDARQEFFAKIDECLQKYMQDSIRKTYADCCKDMAIEKIGKNLGINLETEFGYNAKQDETLNNLIEAYISRILNNPDVSTDEIKSAIDTLVNDYLNLAGLGNNTTPTGVFRDSLGQKIPAEQMATDVDRLRYFGVSTSGLNNLQIKVLSKDLTDAITQAIGNDTNSEAYKIYTDYKNEVDARIPDYVNENIDATKPFKEIKDSIPTLATDFINNVLSKIKADAEAEDLNNAKSKAIAEVDGYYANEKYRDIIKEVFGDDYKATINACTTPDSITTLVNQLKEKIAAFDKAEAERAKYAGSFSALSSIASSISSDSSAIDTIKSGHNNIHTEFGLDAKGNIVFEQNDTTAVYGALSYKIKTELRIKNPAAYELLKDSLDRLIQSAWVMTYSKDYGSSTSHNTEQFVKKVLDNLQLIMGSISNNPALLSVFTGDMSYADSTLTDNLKYYGANSLTYGNDQIIDYDGTYYQKPDGSVHIANTTDDPEYQVTMNELLSRLKTKYAAVANDDIIESVFRRAQLEALNIFQNNIDDCPYGTTNGIDSIRRSNIMGYYAKNTAYYDSYIAVENRDWSGTSRSGDRSDATMQSLVQQTLYCFDRLLYQELAAA